jgi:hypothetical protein
MMKEKDPDLKSWCLKKNSRWTISKIIVSFIIIQRAVVFYVRMAS